MRKILVVEDEISLREVYDVILSTGPYEVSVAHNGKEALELCKVNDFDLILLDLMMPVMDGVGFLRKYSDGQGNLESKVIVLSNLSSGDELTEALKLGAHKSVLKSNLSPSQLLSMVRYELEA
jgi:Response regulators consisting of a CheY-like receiver domain and a winged-helix DNA-binding domain